MFHPNYLAFVAHIIPSFTIPEDLDYVEGRKRASEARDEKIEAGQFAATFLLTVQLRAQNVDQVPAVLGYVKRACERNVRLCLWLAHMFCHGEILHEFLTNCPSDHAPTLGHWPSKLRPHPTLSLRIRKPPQNP